MLNDWPGRVEGNIKREGQDGRGGYVVIAHCMLYQATVLGLLHSKGT
jgi:hypothetical protein